MDQQLSLFESKGDGGSASLIDPISDAQSQALQRFLDKGDKGTDPIVCVNTYSPGRRKKEYWLCRKKWKSFM